MATLKVMLPIVGSELYKPNTSYESLTKHFSEANHHNYITEYQYKSIQLVQVQSDHAFKEIIFGKKNNIKIKQKHTRVPFFSIPIFVQNFCTKKIQFKIIME